MSRVLKLCNYRSGRVIVFKSIASRFVFAQSENVDAPFSKKYSKNNFDGFACNLTTSNTGDAARLIRRRFFLQTAVYLLLRYDRDYRYYVRRKPFLIIRLESHIIILHARTPITPPRSIVYNLLS